MINHFDIRAWDAKKLVTKDLNYDWTANTRFSMWRPLVEKNVLKLLCVPSSDIKIIYHPIPIFISPFVPHSYRLRAVTNLIVTNLISDNFLPNTPLRILLFAESEVGLPFSSSKVGFSLAAEHARGCISNPAPH